MASPKRICSVPGCGKHRAGWGYCDKHYRRFKKYGTPTVTHTTPIGEGERFIREVALNHEADECLIWPYSNNGNGYGRLKIEGKLEYVHRYICKKTHGPAPKGQPLAAHSCGNGRIGCIAKRHLRWASQKENMEDMIGHGTRAYGSETSVAKLTPEDVVAIRAMAGTRKVKDIALSYGMCRHAISKVIKRITYADVP